MRITFLISLLIISFRCLAQQDFYVGGSFYYGLPMNQYGNSKEVLYARKTSNTLGASMFVQYRFWDRVGIEAGFIQQRQHMSLQDKGFAARNPGFQMRLTSTNAYWSWYGALSYTQPFTSKSKIYLSLGYAVNNSGSGSLSKSKTFIVSGETVTYNSNYQNSNASVFIETGLETKLAKNLNWFLGIRFNKGLSNLVEGTYQTQNSGVILGQDKFSSLSSFVALNVGFKVPLFHRDKRKAKPKPLVLPPPHETTPQPKHDAIPQKVEGRMLVVTHTLIVKNATVSVLVWDDQKVDGDRISLNLNGQWIVQDYTLEKKKKAFMVTLKPGENTFVLHALNLGKIKPNTAALIVDDGITQQKLLLESDLESSGTMIIDYKK